MGLAGSLFLSCGNDIEVCAINVVLTSVGASLLAVFICCLIVVDVYDICERSGSNPEEYVFAALQIYVDVANAFLFVLCCIGR